MKARGENQEKIDSKESFHPFMLDLFAVITLILHTNSFFCANIERKVIWKIASSHAMTAVQQDGLIT